MTGAGTPLDTALRPDAAAGLCSVMRQAIDEGCPVPGDYGPTERFAGMAAAATRDRSAAERSFEAALGPVDATPS